jgi:hypothetical protein
LSIPATDAFRPSARQAASPLLVQGARPTDVAPGQSQLRGLAERHGQIPEVARLSEADQALLIEVCGSPDVALAQASVRHQVERVANAPPVPGLREQGPGPLEQAEGRGIVGLKPAAEEERHRLAGRVAHCSSERQPLLHQGTGGGGVAPE